MESCRFPIEVCEKIIDEVVQDHLWSTDRDTLRNCALTCRAWRPRAQCRLWGSPRSLDASSIDMFIADLRHGPDHLLSLIHTLDIYFTYSDDICRLNELLLTSRIPNLHTLELRYASDVAQSPSLNLKLIHPRVLRMRPPLLSHVTRLKLSACHFGSLQMMFRMIWACPRLSSLELNSVWDFLVKTPVTEDAARSLVSTRKHLGACDCLMYLYIDFFNLPVMIPDGLYPLFNVNDGCMFGTSITYLHMNIGLHDLRPVVQRTENACGTSHCAFQVQESRNSLVGMRTGP
ncbi:hypothetical protein BC628DRAFT_778665 [Trametes gibbosa]|nr:hypothetical protein BC628DRAFT_778665 [Trametes gibbosa]